MENKKYRATSMAEAFAKVKADLGRDAVILSTRQYRQGGLFHWGGKNVVEITASREQPGFRPRPRPPRPAVSLSPVLETVGPAGVSGAPLPPSSASGFSVPGGAAAPKARPVPMMAGKTRGFDYTLRLLESEMGKMREMMAMLISERGESETWRNSPHLPELFRRLLDLDVEEAMARKVIGGLENVCPEGGFPSAGEATRALERQLEGMLKVAGGILLDCHPKVVALIGPTGVGKTTTIAKIAANFKLKEGRAVGLITIDTYRIGAVDQLKKFADIMQVPLQVVMTPEELKRALYRFPEPVDLVLIDTAGRSQRDREKVNQLHDFFEVAPPHEIHLVLSLTSHLRNLSDCARRFSDFKVNRLILTKLDEAASIGNLLTLGSRLPVPVSFVTFGQEVPGDIAPADRRLLVEYLLGERKA